MGWSPSAVSPPRPPQPSISCRCDSWASARSAPSRGVEGVQIRGEATGSGATAQESCCMGTDAENAGRVEVQIET